MIFVFVLCRYFQTNSIRIRIGVIFHNRIYLYSYSPDFPNTNSNRIHIQLKFENRIVFISPKVRILNFVVCFLAQKTQNAIFTILSSSICCFLIFLVLIFVIIRIRVQY